MGQRQKKLKEIVLKKFGEYKLQRLNLNGLENSIYLDIVTEVYKNLKGQLDIMPVTYGSWDISTKYFIIELDEERHFNKYRLQTLESNFYKDYKFFSVTAYKTYCQEFEDRCLQAANWGKNWKNNSTEKMFLKSGDNGDLSGNGSSRWRQRAYYDFLKDVTSKVLDIPLIRVSIYDTYLNRTLNELLTNNDDELLSTFIDELIQKNAQV